MKVFIASDHAGFETKQKIIQSYSDRYNLIDLGAQSSDRVDYPDYAKSLCERISDGDIGILICGSGQGMAMAANKYSNIRAALCWSADSAKMARQHNDANVICLGSRMIALGTIYEVLDTFFVEKFEAGRHLDRIKKFSDVNI